MPADPESSRASAAAPPGFEWLAASPLFACIELARDGRVLRANETALRLFGRPREAIEGARIADLAGAEPPRDARAWTVTFGHPGRSATFDAAESAGGARWLVGVETTCCAWLEAGGPAASAAPREFGVVSYCRLERSRQGFPAAVGVATGARFFASLVEHMASSLGVEFALVGELMWGRREVETIAMWRDGALVPSFSYSVEGTPCEKVTAGEPCLYPEGVRARFPRDRFLADHAIEGYVGTPLFDSEGQVLGLIAVLDRRAIPQPEAKAAALQTFAGRAAGEIAHKRREDGLRERERELVRRNRTLLELAASQSIERGDLEASWREITEAGSRALGVRRCGVWLFEDGGRALVCRDVYEARTGAHSGGEVARTQDFPHYARALNDHRCIAAADAAADPRTREFREGYFAPRDVQSTLDAPIRIGGRVVGVLCSESIGARRAWTQEEEQFAASLADLGAIALETAHLREAQADLLRKNRELSLLHRLSEMAQSVTETGAALAAMLAEIAGVFGFDRAAVEVVDEPRQGLALAAWHGFASPPAAAFGREALHAPQALAIVGGAELEAAYRERLGALGAGAAIAAPLRVDRGTIGVLTLLRDTPHAIDPREIESVVRAASALATHVDRRRAHEGQQRLQEQLIQSQKLEAVGTLAGGVAHDFNNLLTAILGYSYLLRQQSTPGDEVDRAAHAIGQAAERAAELTQQLLGFARKGKHKIVAVDLHALIRDVRALCSRTFPKSIHVATALEARRAVIAGDPGQIHQVLLNLAINARDALERGGKLVFATRDVAPACLPRGEHPLLRDVPHVALEVIDDGTGIAPEHLQRVFEPFFTTKEPGKGTGMGLAMVYGIVTAHGGAIEVESELGRGTSFRMFLPLAGADAGPATDARASGIVHGRGHVLVVDDELLVASAAADSLRSIGYTVSIAESGSRAIECVLAGAPRVDVVLLDLVMPRMGGRECLRALKRVDPALPVVLSSGWQPDAETQFALDPAASGFVRKPYQLAELSDAIARAVRARAPV
jgi:signal transduction histidine kinase/ActR/RegA family two-component response regulator